MIVSHITALRPIISAQDPKRRYRNLRLSVYTHNRIEEFRAETGYRSKAVVVDYSIEIVRTRKQLAPVATDEMVFGDNHPIDLTALSGDFKSRHRKLLLETVEAPVLVVVPAAEYSNYKKVGIGKPTSINWKIAPPSTTDI